MTQLTYNRKCLILEGKAIASIEYSTSLEKMRIIYKDGMVEKYSRVSPKFFGALCSIDMVEEAISEWKSISGKLKTSIQEE